jgi:GntR family transcriptional regulator, phosphonate transport system regulatory protein
MNLSRQPGQALWLRIERLLAEEIGAGQLAQGDRLPTEPALMARFGVSRATVRQALASLERRGLVHAEQGRGTFVGPRRLAYPLSERTRFSRNLIEQGFEPGGRLLFERVIAAGTEIGARLGVPEWQSVSHRHGIGEADGVPIELADVYVPLDRFPNWAAIRARHATYTAAFAQYGVRDYRRLSTRIEARMPTKDEAALLDQSPASPVFVMTRVDADLEGRPILYGHAIWCADRVSFDIKPGEAPP